MLYYLSLFTGDISFLNIFSYITFRTGAAIVTSFLLTLLIGPKVVAKLRSYKIQQIEREYGPASHLSKSGTPTMGGILIFASLVVSVLLWARWDNNYIWLLLFTTVTLGIAGVMDDYTKLVKKNPEGMKSSIKLAIQLFTAATYAIFAYLAGNVNFSDYLKIIYVPGAGEITVFMGALIGACLGFLWFNAYPAQVFMGDTSSLFLGGVIGTASLCVKQELLLPIAGGIFVLETLSVMLQMGYFKLTHGKRLFKMAPIHHHFELLGVPEPKVIGRFWIVGAMLMLLALASLKIR